MQTETTPESVIGGCVALIVVAAAIFFLVAWVFMLLWNSICHGAFGWPGLSYWQACGLWLLIGLATGGLRHACTRS